jgi:Protein of unknown function (DUF3102)
MKAGTDMRKTDVSLSNSLTDLAARIKAEHQASANAMQRGVEHAIRVGELLIEAKDKISHGQWLPWLTEHCAMSERTSQLYMRLARSKPELEANPQHVADMTMRGAVAVLENNATLFVATQVQAIDPGAQISATGLKLSPDLTFESWLKIGRLLLSCPGAKG